MKQLNLQLIGDMKVRGLLHQEVIFINSETRRKEKGRIIKIGGSCAEISNQRFCCLEIAWFDIWLINE